MIKTERLSVGYRGKPVVTGVELELRKGEFTVVIGPNASGKTTLLKTLAAVVKPVSGKVLFDGQELSRLSPRRRARVVAAVLTGRPDVGAMTVEEVVALGRYPWTGPVHILGSRDKQVVQKAMEKTGVAHLRGRKVSELSDGQFQRVMIARALAQEPLVLILDEPTTHLDAKSRLEIVTLLRRLAHEEKIVVVASTHELELALRFADKIVLVADGEITIADNPSQLARHNKFLQAFGLSRELYLSPTTLSIEFRGDEENRGGHVFVIAGAGTGAEVYRELVKAGFSVVTGILHENDVDFHVAFSLGLEIVAEKPFTRIGEKSLQKAVEALDKCCAVVYTCPPMGEINFGNVKLLRKALEKGLSVYALGLADEVFDGVENVSSVEHLLQKIQTARQTSVLDTLSS